MNKNILKPLGLAILLVLQSIAQAIQTQPAATPQEWRQMKVNTTAYVSVEDLMQFYGLQNRHVEHSTYNYRAENIQLTLQLGKQTIQLNGCQIQLKHPILQDSAGELIIAKEDSVSILDPILRPRYLTKTPLKRVIIDPRHSDALSDTRPQQRAEKATLTLRYAQDLEKALLSLGYEVLITRRGDYYVSQAQVANMAEMEESILLTIRIDDYNAQQRGNTVYISDRNNACESALGFAIASYLQKWVQLESRGLKQTSNLAKREISAPSVSISLGNIGNVTDRVSVHEQSNRHQIVRAIAMAIDSYGKIMKTEIAEKEGNEKES